MTSKPAPEPGASLLTLAPPDSDAIFSLYYCVFYCTIIYFYEPLW